MAPIFCIQSIKAVRAGRRPGEFTRSARGVTLLELLIVISILAVIMSITVPVIRSARESALLTATSAYQRNSGLSLQMYSTERRDRLPYYGIPGTDSAPLWINGALITDSHWNQSRYWSVELWRAGYDYTTTVTGPEDHYVVPYSPQVRFQVKDNLTYTALASPNYWHASHNRTISQFGPQRWSTIQYPSAKALLLRRHQRRDEPVMSDRWLLWFADGHAGIHHPSELLPGVPRDPWGNDRIPVMSTEHGLFGRDL